LILKPERLSLVLWLCLVCGAAISARTGFAAENLAAAAGEFEKKAGMAAALLLEPTSGRILFAHHPEIIFSRAYPPGSLAKVWASAVFFHNPGAFQFTPEKSIECRGRFSIPEHIRLTALDRRLFHLPPDENNRPSMRCALAAGHGRVNFHSALAKSCNVFFLTHSARNPQLFYETLIKLWRLNESTGSRLSGAHELPLVLQKSVTSLQALASAIGEGGALMVTPLKVSQTYASLMAGTPFLSFSATGGRGARGDSALILQHRPRLLPPLKEIFHSGTLGKISSSEKIDLLAAKTGTATHFQRKFKTHGWLALHFKLKAKDYFLLTFIESGSGSGQARQLAEELLRAMTAPQKTAHLINKADMLVE
jgi:cell division protein FtsI/penicillin-binding protein 2